MRRPASLAALTTVLLVCGSYGGCAAGTDGTSLGDASTAPADAAVALDGSAAPDASAGLDAAPSADGAPPPTDASAPDASAPDASAPDAGAGWAPCPRLPGGPRQETAVVARGGELYVLGGFDGATRVVDRVEIYDPRTGMWRDGPRLPVAMHHAQAAVVGDRLFVIGFLTGLDFRADGRGFVLEPGATAWAPIAALPAGTQRGGGATAVVGTRVYVLGGLRSGAVVDVTVYDSAADTHAPGPALPESRDHLGAAGVGDRVVVIGGRAGRIESHQPDTWILDPGGVAWRSARPMPTSRGGFALAAQGDRVFVLGGEGDTGAPRGVFDDVESYLVDADTWTAHAPMPDPRHGTGAAAIDGVIYVPAGADRQAFGAVATCSTYRP